MTDADPVVVIGAGPAGLMAAEVIRAAGTPVVVHDGMPSVARKFLRAGIGGLNLTHAEPFDRFVERYGARREPVGRWLAAFGPVALRDWVHELGIGTFVGTSGRVFPEQLKAAPLLRAWLHRLRGSGVQFRMRHRWVGWWDDGALRFDADETRHRPPATVLALGGASWPRLGSDGAWFAALQADGIELAPLRPANCGFDVGWSAAFVARHAGEPVKSVVAWPDGQPGLARQGEFVVTRSGVEGSLVYHHSAGLRDRLTGGGPATWWLDLAPGRTLDRLVDGLARPRGGRSVSNHLRVRAGIDGVKAGLLRECVARPVFDDPQALAAAIKACPVRLVAARPLQEAISTAGGVRFEALDERGMLRQRPGVFCAGEMLDWEAPTGGYLLTACLASGRAVGTGVIDWLRRADSVRADRRGPGG